MADIVLSGIDRGGTHENAVNNACSLIINARKKGSKWEYVGDKIDLGIAWSLPANTPMYWHYRYEENHSGKTIIIVFTHTRTFEARDIQGNGSYIARFLNPDNSTAFFVPAGENVLSIHSLNDYIIVDTDKNKYFFVWENDLGTFCRLPDLPELIPMIDQNKEQKPISEFVYKTNGLFVNNIEEITHINQYCDNQKNITEYAKELIRMFSTKLKEYVHSKNLIIPSFRFVLAYELTDGSIIKISDVYNYTNWFPYLDTDGFAFNSFCYNIGTFLDFSQKDNQYHSLNGINEYADNFVYNRINSYSIKNIKVYKKFDIILGSTVYKDLKRWLDAGILKSISVYITAPNDYLKTEDCYEATPYFYINNTSATRYSRYFVCPYDNEAAMGMKEPFYKVGEFDILRQETKFSLKSEMQQNIEGNTNTLNIKHDLSRVLVSKENNVYNGMLHKFAPKNIVKEKELFIYAKPETPPAGSQCYLDIKINNKWKRYYIFYFRYVNNPPSTSYVEFPYDILLNTNAVQEANFVYLHNGKAYIIEKLKIDKSNFLNLSVLTKKGDLGISVAANETTITSIIYSDWGKGFYEIGLNVAQKAKTEIVFPDGMIHSGGGKLRIDFPSTGAGMEEAKYEITNGELSFQDKNRMQLSATNNPFIYPAERSYRFNNEDNVVIKAETSSVELAAYKFGALPIYVFTEQGIWLMEVGQGDIAYSSQHLLENVPCLNNPNFIKRVLGGVVFCTNKGICVVSGSTIKEIPCGVEGNTTLQGIADLENDLFGQTGIIANAAERIDNIVKDYFTEQSFSVYDHYHNEILFIEPTKDFIIVLNTADFSWSVRKDIYIDHIMHFSGSISINNKDALFLFTDADNYAFYALDEYKAAKSIYNRHNNIVLFAATTLFSPNYIKVEHLIARYFQHADDQHKSNIYLYIIGSRDGVEWKIVAKGKLADVNKPIQGIQIRRCFVSCRYFQFVFARKNTNAADLDRLMNNFSGFSFDFLQCDNERKLR